MTKQPQLRGPMSNRLRTARTSAGFSRRELAELIGMSERAINYYENPKYAGARKAPFVREWASACGREFEELWGSKEQPLGRTGWLRGTAGCRRVA